MEQKTKKFFFAKIYHFLFKEKFKKKLIFNFPKNISRLDLIKRTIIKNNYQSYLEVGCDDDNIFNSINIKKIGVDPFCGGNFRGTSDEFFSQNKNKFDCIFIDGLHIYKQVKKDILNSIDCLNENGIIILHDCLPKQYLHKRFRDIDTYGTEMFGKQLLRQELGAMLILLLF